MKTAKKLLIFLLAMLIAAAGTAPAAAGSEGRAEKIIDSVTEFSLSQSGADSVQEWIDGALTADAGAGSEWYVIALSGYGSYDFSKYEAALLSYLSQNDIGSASSRLKYALALIAAGSDAPYINEAANNSIGEQGIMSLIFGLHLLNNGISSDDCSISELKEEILSQQLDDGGWALGGEIGDVDITSMAMQAIAPYYSADNSVDKAIDTALVFLSERQQENGGFSSYGVNNSESASQVLVALSSLGIDAESDSRFIKNGNSVLDAIASFALPDGSFSHKQGEGTNSTATAQAFYSAVSYAMMKSGKKLYIFEKTDIPVSTTAKAAAECSVEATAEHSSTEKHTQPETEATKSTAMPAETSHEEKTTAPQTKKTTEDGYKLRAVIAIITAAIITCLLLILLKKKSIKNILLVMAVAAAGIAFVMLTNISLPEDFYNSKTKKENSSGTVTISISCSSIADKSAAHIPESGIILDTAEFEIEEGDTACDILLEAAAKHRIHLETSGSEGMIYVEGIGNIYEMDFGDLSGWVYFVNGESPCVGCDEYILSNGDKIEWHYTCNMGKDIIL